MRSLFFIVFCFGINGLATNVIAPHISNEQLGRIVQNHARTSSDRVIMVANNCSRELKLKIKMKFKAFSPCFIWSSYMDVNPKTYGYFKVPSGKCKYQVSEPNMNKRYLKDPVKTSQSIICLDISPGFCTCAAMQ